MEESACENITAQKKKKVSKLMLQLNVFLFTDILGKISKGLISEVLQVPTALQVCKCNTLPSQASTLPCT